MFQEMLRLGPPGGYFQDPPRFCCSFTRGGTVAKPQPHSLNPRKHNAQRTQMGSCTSYEDASSPRPQIQVTVFSLHSTPLTNFPPVPCPPPCHSLPRSLVFRHAEGSTKRGMCMAIHALSSPSGSSGFHQASVMSLGAHQGGGGSVLGQASPMCGPYRFALEHNIYAGYGQR